MLYLKCQGQVVSIDKDERFADKYINANTVHWEFCERWNGMTVTAQFTQDGNTYNVLVDEVTYTTTLPNEIVAGEVDISAFGVHPETGVRITTVPVKKKIDKSGFIGDGETVIPPTPDLYAQLIAKIDDVGEIPVEEIEKAVNAYMDENYIQTGATPEQAAQIEANREAIENYVPPVTSVNGMTGDVVIEAGGEADSVRWENVMAKPSAYPPAEHEHTWNDVKEKPSEFPPENHSHDWSDVTGKPETYPPSEHEHSYNDLNDKPTIPVVPKFLPNPYALTINGKEYDGSEEVNVVISAGGGEADSVAWDNVTGKPSTYPPESHSHAEYATTGALDQLSEQKANQTGWTANKLIGTDANGNLVAQEPPETDGGDADTLGGKAPDYYLNTEEHDHIIAEGTSGIWSWRKWNSGIAECWGTYTHESITVSSVGNIYIAVVPGAAYPFSFSKKPFLLVTPGQSNAYQIVVGGQDSGSVEATCKFALGRPTSGSVFPNLNLYARGEF